MYECFPLLVIVFIRQNQYSYTVLIYLYILIKNNSKNNISVVTIYHTIKIQHTSVKS